MKVQGITETLDNHVSCKRVGSVPHETDLPTSALSMTSRDY